MRDLSNVAEVLREAFATLPQIEAAFVFGSVARGEANEESDIDLLLVTEEEIPRSELGRRSLELSVEFRREVNVVRYTRIEFADEVARGEGFVHRVVCGPKLWVLGDERLLATLLLDP